MLRALQVLPIPGTPPLSPWGKQGGCCNCGVPDCTRSLCPALPRPLSHRTSGSRGKIYSCRSLYFSLCDSPRAGKRRDRSPREASTFPETWQTSFPLSGSPSAPPEGNNADICLQPQDEGPCRALLRRYYYDRSTQSCRLFYYGGCEGNANNFETLEDCNEACWRIESKWPCSSSDLLAASNLIFQIPFSTVRFSLYFLNH